MIRIKIMTFLLIMLPYALESATDCSKLRKGQFMCPDPDSSYKYIDERTQQVEDCTREGKAIGELIMRVCSMMLTCGNSEFLEELVFVMILTTILTSSSLHSFRRHRLCRYW